MHDKMSSLDRKLSQVLKKRGFSLPLVAQAVLAYSNGLIRQNIITDSMTKKEFREKLDNIAGCGTLFEVREYGDRQIIHNGNYCKNPIVCPVCAERVSRRRRAIWAPMIRKAVKRYPFVYMLVLTIGDGPDMRRQLEALAKARKSFRKMGQRRGLVRGKGEAGKIGAATVNTEIVFSAENTVHVHDHLLVFCKDRIDYAIYDQDKKRELQKIYGENIPQVELDKTAVSYIEFQGKKVPVSKLSREWHKATKGAGLNINCTPLNYRNYLDNPKYKGRYIEKYEDWLVLNSVECLKYNSKLSIDLEKKKITAQQYADLLLRKGNKRLFSTTGDFRNRKKNDESLFFDEKEIERLEYIEEIKNAEYVIRSATIAKGREGYDLSGPLEGPLFSDSDPPGAARRYRLKYQGLIMGDYFQLRHSANKYKEKYHPEDDGFAARLEDYLDRIRAAMRGRIKELWQTDLSSLDVSRYAVPSFLV